MDFLLWLVDFIIHVDAHLREFVDAYGTWIYVLLFAIVFVETGLVVMPFLPGMTTSPVSTKTMATAARRFTMHQRRREARAGCTSTWMVETTSHDGRSMARMSSAAEWITSMPPGRTVMKHDSAASACWRCFAAGTLLFSFPLLALSDRDATLFGLPLFPGGLLLIWAGLIAAIGLVATARD